MPDPETVKQKTPPPSYAERVGDQWQLRQCQEHQWEYTPTTLLVPQGEYCRNCGSQRDPDPEAATEGPPSKPGDARLPEHLPGPEKERSDHRAGYESQEKGEK